MIQFDHITKAYGKTIALDDLNLTIQSGEIFGLIGHNGAGKTTTISLLTSIIEASQGHIIVDNLNLAEHRDDIKK
ncbi:ATP-binding cassette domain-containing protein, partial [Streptococcus ruminantium]